MESKKKTTRYIPLLIAVCLIAGIYIGVFYTKRFSTSEHNGLGIVTHSSNKLNGLLHIIDNEYVDTVNINELIENAMPQVLGELDPHSSYIPAKDLQAVNDELSASFSGIGIQFTIQQDTIHISDVIAGGPSEKVGLMPGDRIVEIDDSAFVGKIVTNSESMKRLKGPKGSQVKLGIFRHGEKEILHFTIIRGDIPNKSIKAAYMMDDKYGYINKVDESAIKELQASAFSKEGNYKGEIELLEDALEIYQASFGQNHRGNIGRYQKLAEACHNNCDETKERK